MTRCLLRCFSHAQLETTVGDRRLTPLNRMGALRPHAVILHRDEYHQGRLDYVAKVLTNVVGALSSEEAMVIAQTAFVVGRAVVIECPKETAEHYQVCLEAYGLTVTVEEIK